MLGKPRAEMSLPQPPPLSNSEENPFDKAVVLAILLLLMGGLLKALGVPTEALESTAGLLAGTGANGRGVESQ